jgi:predicted PurR-regulated permease PerM
MGRFSSNTMDPSEGIIMLQDKRPYTFDRVIRLSLTAGLLWGLVWLLGYLSDVLIPFAVALLMAYLVNPLVLRVQRKVPNHTAAVFLSLFLVVCALALVLLLVIPMIVSEIGQMGKVLSDLVNNSELAKRAASILPPDIWLTVKEYIGRDDVQQFFKTDRFGTLAESVLRKVLPGVWGLISGTTTVLMGLVGLSVIGLYLVFLLLDYRKIKENWQNLIPPTHRDLVVGFVKDFDQGMNRYFRAQAVVAGITGLLTAIGFAIIGLPLGILLGLFVGLLNMVPYLQLIAVPPALALAMIHALETGMGIWTILGLTALVFVVVQAIQDGLVVPRLMGEATGLSPAMIMLSLSIWGKLLGMLGLLIALPISALLLAYYRRFLISPPEAVSEEPDIFPPDPDLETGV